MRPSERNRLMGLMGLWAIRRLFAEQWKGRAPWT